MPTNVYTIPVSPPGRSIALSVGEDEPHTLYVCRVSCARLGAATAQPFRLEQRILHRVARRLLVISNADKEEAKSSGEVIGHAVHRVRAMDIVLGPWAAAARRHALAASP